MPRGQFAWNMKCCRLNDQHHHYLEGEITFTGFLIISCSHAGDGYGIDSADYSLGGGSRPHNRYGDGLSARLHLSVATSSVNMVSFGHVHKKSQLALSISLRFRFSCCCSPTSQSFLCMFLSVSLVFFLSLSFIIKFNFAPKSM